MNRTRNETIGWFIGRALYVGFMIWMLPLYPAGVVGCLLLEVSELRYEAWRKRDKE